MTENKAFGMGRMFARFGNHRSYRRPVLDAVAQLKREGRVADADKLRIAFADGIRDVEGRTR
jgi:hypothetical protein